LWFSPDGSKIAYLKLDDSNIVDFPLHFYQRPRGQYPTEFKYKYPKPGTPNPKVSVWVAVISQDTVTSSEIIFDPKDVYDNGDILITEVKWLKNQALIRMMNRVQDKQRIFLVLQESNGSKWTAKKVRDEVSDDGAWIQFVIVCMTYIFRRKAFTP
jgi:dipeptidyl aminopeptidase